VAIRDDAKFHIRFRVKHNCIFWVIKIQVTLAIAKRGIFKVNISLLWILQLYTFFVTPKQWSLILVKFSHKHRRSLPFTTRSPVGLLEEGLWIDHRFRQIVCNLVAGSGVTLNNVPVAANLRKCKKLGASLKTWSHQHHHKSVPRFYWKTGNVSRYVPTIMENRGLKNHMFFQ